MSIFCLLLQKYDILLSGIRVLGFDQGEKSFHGSFADMESMFVCRFPSEEAQWAEFRFQLGPMGDQIESEKVKWVMGVQRWFRGAWGRGEVA